MDRRAQAELLADLHYILQVMEEKSHLGLDDEAADKVRRILLRHIATIEKALSSDSGASTATEVTVHDSEE